MREILLDIGKLHKPIRDEKLCFVVLPGVDDDPDGLFAPWDAEYPLQAAIAAGIAYDADVATLPTQLYTGWEEDLYDYVFNDTAIPEGSVVFHPVQTLDSVITICAAAQSKGHRAVVLQATERIPEELCKIPRLTLIPSKIGYPTEYIKTLVYNLKPVRG